MDMNIPHIHVYYNNVVFKGKSKQSEKLYLLYT